MHARKCQEGRREEKEREKEKGQAGQEGMAMRREGSRLQGREAPVPLHCPCWDGGRGRAPCPAWEGLSSEGKRQSSSLFLSALLVQRGLPPRVVVVRGHREVGSRRDRRREGGRCEVV